MEVGAMTTCVHAEKSTVAQVYVMRRVVIPKAERWQRFTYS